MMTLNYESNAVEPKDAAVNLYILPYETYEEHIKSDFNLFKRTDALYQYEDKLFSFYSWDKYVSFFNNIIPGFSTDIETYDLEGNFSVLLSGFFESQRKLLRQYLFYDIPVNVKVFVPSNEFICDGIMAFLYKIGVKEAEVINLNQYTLLPVDFFETMQGSKRPTNIYSYLYYQYFLTYLDHIIRLLYIKSSVKHPMSTFSIMFGLFFNNQKAETRNAVRIYYSNTKAYGIAHLLRDLEFTEGFDGVAYPVKSWENRALPEIYGDSTIFNFDGSYYIQDEAVDFNRIMKREFARLTTNEIYYLDIFENLLPQPYITNQISKMDNYVKDNNEIEMYPDVDGLPKNFITYLSDAMNDIIFADESEVFNTIRFHISKIRDSLNQTIRNTDLPIGVCPACETNGVIKARTGYFCNNCNGFALWEKTMNDRVGYFLTKSQMAKLLKPGASHEAKIKNATIRLYSNARKNKASEDENSRFWDIEVK